MGIDVLETTAARDKRINLARQEVGRLEIVLEKRQQKVRVAELNLEDAKARLKREEKS